MKEIYLAGGCYWGVEKYVSCIRGVVSTEVGFACGHVANPSYDQVKHTDTGHAETVRVCYDEAELSLRALLRLFFRIIDPTLLNQQGEDVGKQYRTGVYWTSPEDETIVREELARLAQNYDAPLVVETQKLTCFYPAEEYHQKYLDKNPHGYCHVPFADITWVKTVNPQDFAL